MTPLQLTRAQCVETKTYGTGSRQTECAFILIKLLFTHCGNWWLLNVTTAIKFLVLLLLDMPWKKNLLLHLEKKHTPILQNCKEEQGRLFWWTACFSNSKPPRFPHKPNLQQTNCLHTLPNFQTFWFLTFSKMGQTKPRPSGYIYHRELPL